MAKKIKDLFYGWGKETLKMKKFEKMRDVEKWVKFVKENPTKWPKYHNEFISAVNNKWQTYEEKLLSTSEGKEKLIKLLEIKNEEVINEIRNK